MGEQTVMDGLYCDAIFLKENGRKRGCLCLLLCLIDALAKLRLPESGNRDRYVKYLKSKLNGLGIDDSTRIEEKGDLVHLADIVYEYFRCNMVHEGDSRDSLSYEVQLEYEESGRFLTNGNCLMDRVNKKIIYKADWLIEILDQIIKSELKV